MESGSINLGSVMNKRWILLAVTSAVFFCPALTASADYSLGDSGEAVKAIQRQLTQAGCLVRADGKYNEATVKAVKKFQRKKHLMADGVVGPVTYKALTGKELKRQTSQTAKGHKGKKNPLCIETGDKKVQWHRPGKMTGRVKAIVDEAKKLVGVPYHFGGTTPKGFDCSGFIQYVFHKKGVPLPRSADEQFGEGEKIGMNFLEPGDLVFFTTYESGVSHSGLYLGDGYFISATSSRGVAVATMKDGYWRERYIGAKRVL